MNLRSSVKREALEDASEQDTKAENIPLKPDNSNVQERGVSGLKERETKPEDPLKNTIITSKSQGVKTAPCDPSLSIEDDDMPMELTAPPPIRYEITNYLGTSPLAVTPPLPDLSGDMDMDVDTEEMNIPVEIRVASDPSERRRVLMDAVVLPKRVPRRNDEKVKVEPEEVPITLHIKAEPLDEDDKVKLNLLRNNPSVKIKKETILDEEGAGRRLLALGPDALEGFPVDLDERIKAAKTTRAWMSDTFGGSPQGCCPKINTKKFTHGMKNITYKTYVYNPEGPQRPGAHGLEFGCYGNIKLSTDVIRLLMRTNAPLWQFMGLYTWFPSTPLSVDEWNSQTASFKRHWVEKILEKPWARRTRTRIGLRTHFISEPTEEEVEEAYINEEYSNVSAEDIRQALDSGEELIHVWIMKCIGYDEAFQRKIATMPRGWVPPKKQKLPRKKTVARNIVINKKVTRKATTAKHRSRATKAGLKLKRR